MAAVETSCAPWKEGALAGFAMSVPSNPHYTHNRVSSSATSVGFTQRGTERRRVPTSSVLDFQPCWKQSLEKPLPGSQGGREGCACPGGEGAGCPREAAGVPAEQGGWKGSEPPLLEPGRCCSGQQTRAARTPRQAPCKASRGPAAAASQRSARTEGWLRLSDGSATPWSLLLWAACETFPKETAFPLAFNLS